MYKLYDRCISIIYLLLHRPVHMELIEIHTDR